MSGRPAFLRRRRNFDARASSDVFCCSWPIFLCARAFPPYFYFRRKFYLRIPNRTPHFLFIFNSDYGSIWLSFRDMSMDRRQTNDSIAWGVPPQAGHLISKKVAKSIIMCIHGTQRIGLYWNYETCTCTVSSSSIFLLPTEVLVTHSESHTPFPINL